MSRGERNNHGTTRPPVTAGSSATRDMIGQETADAWLAALGTAVPELAVSQEEAGAWLLHHYGDRLSARNRRIAGKIFAHPAIAQRRIAVDGLSSLTTENQDRRIARFTRQAVALAGRAAARALTAADCRPEQVTVLIVNTCTGYLCPGLSGYLMEELALPPRVQTFDLVGGGCGGALPNLQLAAALVRADREAIVLSVAVEICSATFQMDDDLSLIISNALFGDGAAAAVISRRPGQWRIVASANLTAPALRESVRYVYRNGELHNQLNEELPTLVTRQAARVVADLLQAKGLRPADIGCWALHPGGAKIIASLQRELALSEAQLAPTRAILSAYGNMSSPSVLFVLDEISQAAAVPDDYCLLIAYGAGLAAHALLLQREDGKQ